ncbi:Profilin-4 [Cricetulus griseus]|uniref:Profilin-4 n=1 Tax=Cricetulus griseus TaxID=10029 RepID=G3GZN9_CRIGR|nr:Profilin-4 [Cricetulus griseus]
MQTAYAGPPGLAAFDQALQLPLAVMPNDVRTLVNGFAKNPLITRREGLYFREKDYKCVRADDYSLYAKNENTGVIVVKTHLYLLVATYTAGMYPSVCVEATEKLGKSASH